MCLLMNFEPEILSILILLNYNTLRHLFDYMTFKYFNSKSILSKKKIQIICCERIKKLTLTRYSPNERANVPCNGIAFPALNALNFVGD